MADVEVRPTSSDLTRVVMIFVAAAFASASITLMVVGNWNLGAVLFVGVLGSIPTAVISAVGWETIGRATWRRRKSAPAIASLFGAFVAGLSLVTAALVLGIGFGSVENDASRASILASLAFMSSVLLFGPAALVFGVGAGVISHYWTSVPRAHTEELAGHGGGGLPMASADARSQTGRNG